MLENTPTISNKERTKQQLISTNSNGGTMNDNVAVIPAAVEVAKLSLSDLSSGVNFVNFEPYITLTVSPFEHELLPDDIVLADGNTYSVSSPLRKADPEKGAHPGVFREPLAKVFQTVGEMFSGDLRYFGDVDNISNHIAAICSSVEETITRTICAANNGEQTFSVAQSEVKDAELPASLENSEEFIEDEAPVKVDSESLEFSFDDFVSVFVYGTLVDANTIRLTININLVAPLFVKGKNSVKNLAAINKILYTMAENTIGAQNFKLLYILSSDNLLSHATVQLLTDLQGDEADVSTVGVPYLRDVIESGSDPFGLYPINYTLSDAVESVFAYGGDIVLVINDIKKK